MEDLNDYLQQRIFALESHIDLLQLSLDKAETENKLLREEANALYLQLNKKKR